MTSFSARQDSWQAPMHCGVSLRISTAMPELRSLSLGSLITASSAPFSAASAEAHAASPLPAPPRRDPEERVVEHVGDLAEAAVARVHLVQNSSLCDATKTGQNSSLCDAAKTGQ
eukprot:12311492-Heterocapsa_arctica.AAC.1